MIKNTVYISFLIKQTYKNQTKKYIKEKKRYTNEKICIFQYLCEENLYLLPL